MAEETKESKLDFFVKKLGYTKTLFFIFILPFIFLFKTILNNVQKKPFFLSVGMICVLGWSWSMLLSYQGWWTFPQEFILGFYVLPYLPLEEFIIYPIGGVFSIFFYTYPTKRIKLKWNPLLHWIFIGTVTALFGIFALIKKDTNPYYLHSQFVLYNLLCFVLAAFISREINVPGLFISVFSLSTVGFFWDYAAFRYGWWVYHAITGVKIAGIPVEDFNFYLMAPTAAISLYLLLCRFFRMSQVP